MSKSIRDTAQWLLDNHVPVSVSRLTDAADSYDHLVETLQKAALCLDDMEKANACLGRDVMAATCLVVSNEIRNALIKAGI